MWRILICVLIVCSSSLAQQPTCEINIPISFSSDFGDGPRQTVVPAFREVNSDEFTFSLSGKDFTGVLERAHAQRFVLVVDHSVQVEKQWPFILETMKSVLRKVPRSQDFRLIVFDDKTYSAGTPEEVRNILGNLRKFADMPKLQNKRLYETLDQALHETAFGPGDVLLAITNGVNSGGNVGADELKQRLMESHARFSTILVKHELYEMTDIRDGSERWIRDMAECTGGTVFYMDYQPISTPQIVLQPPSDYVSNLLEFYKLTVSMPRGDKHLRFKATSRNKNKLKVIAPSEVIACAPDSGAAK